MPDIQKDIRNWLFTQPDWLQQAAEILLSSGNVSDADIQHLIERLKTPEGQQVTTHRAFNELTPTSTPTSELRLLSIGDINGIENLGPREPLTFGPGNLCVVYGHNGSGKSGYTRLLKRVCGKPRAVELKSNVFQPSPAIRKCTISYQKTGITQNIEWPANSAPVEDLRPVDIFDTDVALSYLTGETEASYIPPLVALFRKLATVCKRIHTQLQSEKERLVKQLPTLPPQYAATPAGNVYRNLKSNLNEVEIRNITQWGDDDKQRLEQLTGRLTADNPAALAQRKRETKIQVDQLTELLRTTRNSFSQEGIAAIRELRTEALTKRQIATESAQVASARLEGIGTDTWRALWEAARAYSQTAYPDKDYPVTNDSLCVLCHQEVGKDAQQRLRDFETFIQSTIENEAKAAAMTYQNALNNLPKALDQDRIRTQCQAAGLTETEWITQLSDFWGSIRNTREVLLNEEINAPATPIVLPNDVCNRLRALSQELERDAAQYEQDAANFDRIQANKDKLNLEARRWTAQQATAIYAEINRLRQIDAYNSWERSANSRGISIKAGEIAKQVITQAFVDRFNRELKALGASRIRVELTNTRTERGKVLHKLRLKGAQTDQDPPESVLSEGESRIVSLAAFLADVAEQPHAVPFIFDDPISSLDHDFEWHVANRLAELSRKRQVLIFTHRLSLYGAMEDVVKKLGEEWKKKNFHQCCIETFSGVAGCPTNPQTWNSKTRAANNDLIARLDKAKKEGETSGAEAYKNLAQGICSDFRKLLERTVEDDLLNEVVKRHRRSVTTDNRLAHLQHITQEDCRFIDDLMTKYSCYEHSQSSEAPVFIPDENELRADLEALKTWREEFKNRPVKSIANA